MTRTPPYLSLLAFSVAMLASGCGLLPAGLLEPGGCPAALLEGTLVRHEASGLGVHQPEVDVIYPVEWEAGWSVREVDGVLELMDGAGRVVGVEGDGFSAGGGFTPGPDEVFQPCGPMEITSGDP